MSASFRDSSIEEIGAKTELQIQLGEAELEVGRILGIGFRDFALSEPGASRPAITAQRVTARVALLPLFRAEGDPLRSTSLPTDGTDGTR